jgi:hypothetical protein
MDSEVSITKNTRLNGIVRRQEGHIGGGMLEGQVSQLKGDLEEVDHRVTYEYVGVTNRMSPVITINQHGMSGVYLPHTTITC